MSVTLPRTISIDINCNNINCCNKPKKDSQCCLRQLLCCIKKNKNKNKNNEIRENSDSSDIKSNIH